MEKIGFIGACDKTNILIYIAKILEIMGKRVIVVDTTMTQKTKYLVPSISPSRTFITDYENVDYAGGFKSLQDLSQYLGVEEQNMQYDYMLIDIDHEKAVEYFEIENKKQNYFVTAFDMYSLTRGVEILKNFTEPMNLSKILYDYSIKKEDEEYLNYLTLDTKVAWNEFDLYLNISGYDKQVIEENERVHKTRFKKLSPSYQEGLLFIVQDIMKEISVNKMKKMIKE